MSPADLAYVEGHARDQVLLLPASVEDDAGADNPARLIGAIGDDPDPGGARFVRSRFRATGRPGYDPADMLKLYLYGYLGRMRPKLIWLLQGVFLGSGSVTLRQPMPVTVPRAVPPRLVLR